MKEAHKEAFSGDEVEKVELKEIYGLLIGGRDKAVKAFQRAAQKDKPPGGWTIGNRKDYGFLAEYYDAGSHKWFPEGFPEGLGWFVTGRAEVALSLHLQVDKPNLKYVELRELKKIVCDDLGKALGDEKKQGAVSPEQIRIGDVDPATRTVHAFWVFPTEESFVNVFRDVTLKKG